MLWQPIRPFEFTSPVVDVLKYQFLALKPISTIIFALPQLRKLFTIRQVNERILEIPFVLSKTVGKVLDIGSCESPISLMLASSGHKVTSIDIRISSFKHLNIENIQADITKWKRENYFDTIISLSTLEHIGLEVYGGAQMKNGDQLALENIYTSLKVGGKLLLTIPASTKFYITPTWRSYDIQSIKSLLINFKKIKIVYGVRSLDQEWNLVNKIPASHIFDPQMPSAVALVEAIK